VSILGEGDRDLSDFPLTKVGWAQIGGMVRALRNADVTEMVIVGSVRRPDLGAIKPDLGFFLNLPAIARVVGYSDSIAGPATVVTASIEPDSGVASTHDSRNV